LDQAQAKKVGKVRICQLAIRPSAHAWAGGCHPDHKDAGSPRHLPAKRAAVSEKSGFFKKTAPTLISGGLLPSQ
jgi:hypothetical protein